MDITIERDITGYVVLKQPNYLTGEDDIISIPPDNMEEFIRKIQEVERRR